MKISFFNAKRNLFITWLVCSLLIFIFFILQIITGRYEGIVNQAWAWFLPNILPTLLLMATSFFANLKTTDKQNKKEIPSSFYLITLGISIFYMLIFIIILFSYDSNKGKILDYYRELGLALTALQSILSACLGVFFVKNSTE